MRAEFSERLLEWWATHGRHDLPWQRPRTPFRVWVSEIMLQQTQVATVIPYFERFVERFPDLAALAAADIDEVLALWSGLGYYARARNLHKAGRECMERHGGELPVSAEELAALPGIGESTANAIVSQAHDIPAAVLDGNVRRVLARHEAIGGWAGEAAVRKRLWQAAGSRVPKTRGADYTQAIMDLGATVCTRTGPDCRNCPVSSDCRAFETGTIDHYPAPRPRFDVREKKLHMLLLTRADGAILLERRPPAGIWGGLWSLPDGDDAQGLNERLGVDDADVQDLPAIEHRLTHLRLEIRPGLARAGPDTQGVKCNDDLRWFGSGDWRSLGLPKPVLRLLEDFIEGER